MTRKLLLLFVLADVAACSSSTPGTGPTSVATGTLPLAWGGTAKYTIRQVGNDTESEITLEAEDLTWFEDTRAAPTADAMTYSIGTGVMKVTYLFTGRNEGGQCSQAGESEFALGAANGHLVVSREGRYSGWMRRDRFEVDTMVFCTGGVRRTATGGVELALEIDGSADRNPSDDRLQGTTVETFSSLGFQYTVTRSWDFRAFR